MTSNSVQNCSSCSVLFAELDTPVKCDGCISVFHTKCTGLSPSELKCLTLKTRNLKYFCKSCNNCLVKLTNLKIKKIMVIMFHIILKNSSLMRSAIVI